MINVISCKNTILGYLENHKIYDLLYIDNLDIAKGAWHIIYGPSGLGKTTLLTALANLTRPLSGTVDISYQLCYRAYMPQYPCLLEGFSVADNIGLLSKIKGLYDHRKCISYAENVGLLSKLYLPIDGLSGGERMRVSLLRTMLLNPQTIFLDEPSCHWDREMTLNIMSFIKQWQQNNKVTLIMVTHDVDVLPFADTVTDLRSYIKCA